MELEDKRIIVTGGAQGIGEAVVRRGSRGHGRPSTCWSTSPGSIGTHRSRRFRRTCWSVFRDQPRKLMAPTVTATEVLSVAGCLGDLNGDGHQDLMWYDSTTGEVSSWLLNGYGNVVTKQSLQWACSYSSTCANHWVIVNPDRRVPDLPPVCRLCRGT
jgi:hypothetical protein